MNILLTGSSGFLGRRLLPLLANAGHTTTTIPHQDWATFSPPSIPHDVLIHAGSPVPKKKEDDTPHVSQTYIDETIQLYTRLSGTISHLVYISTAEIYGLVISEAPIPEETLPNPPSWYAAGKLAGEAISLAFGNKEHIPVTIVRFSVLYGSEDTINRAIPNFVHASRSGKPLVVTSPNSKRDYLHVEDAGRAILATVQQKKPGIFNVGSGKTTTIHDAAARIKRETHSSSPIHLGNSPPAHLVLNITKFKKTYLFSPQYTFPENLLSSE